MSVETLPTGPLFGLSLIARPGISIRLLDSKLQEIELGSGQLHTKQPQGLYLVEWSSAGEVSKTMLHIDGTKEITEIRFDPSDKNSSDSLDPNANERTALVDAVYRALKPSEGDYDSSIVLIFSGEVDALARSASVDLRLYDLDEVAMRANRADAPGFELSDGERATCYRVKPGRYYIGFRSILNERLGQSVPALAGRQTLVFLTVTRSKLIVASGEQFDEEDSVGVDPARTTLLSVRGDEEGYRIRERVRLAGLMLFNLKNATYSIPEDVAAVLDEPATDPLLKLYGALVTLSGQLHQRISKADGSQEHREQPTPDRSWAQRLRNWIGDPTSPGVPSDALAACWALRRIDPRGLNNEKWELLPSRLEVPPMLECAWRWAIEESISHPNAVRETPIIAAAARSGGGSQPWLCWHLAAAKARFSPVSATAGDLTSLLSEIARKVASLVDRNDLQRSFTRAALLPPEIHAAAIRALQLAPPTKTDISSDTVAELAVALGLPSRLFHERLWQTSEALDSLNPSTNKSGRSQRSTSNTSEQAPGLSRRIRHRDNLQKGRFGGEPSRNGFTASAKFEKLSKNWVKATLRVEGPGVDGEEVQFHLHDSFKPPLETRKFKGGVAKVSVTTWGGFALGVWIPAHRVELELDLQKVKDAPRIVRER